MTFQSTSISSLVISGDTATVSGSGIANGLPVTFTLSVVDKPETFSIELSNGYSATWTPEDREGRDPPQLLVESADPIWRRSVKRRASSTYSAGLRRSEFAEPRRCVLAERRQ